MCNFDAIHSGIDSSNDDLSKKIAEYVQAIVHGRPQFHISLVMDVSPCCDCHADNDAPIIPDVGMFASFDCVALDTACADACNRQPILPGSFLAEKAEEHDFHDHFKTSMPATDWRVCMQHAEKIGVGSMKYELVRVK
ncbi:MAG: DUF362 domain-containing protein, partial [Oscillospiraceae bacterium]